MKKTILKNTHILYHKMNFQTTMMYDCDFAYMIRAWNQATLLRDNVTCDF